LSSPSRRIAAFLALGLAWPLLSRAQELEIAVSPSPVGSGARAAGMADAFVAIADDATAASWNPAGLVQLERPEISIVGSYNAIDEEFSAWLHPEAESRHDSDNLDLNFLSVVYPLPALVLGRNVCVSLNYQRKYDFTRRFNLKYHTASSSSGGMPLTMLRTLKFEQTGGLSTITPAIALELTHRLSVGAAFNFWRSSALADNSWEQRSEERGAVLFGPMFVQFASRNHEEYRDFTGENLTLGLLWNPIDKWSLGLRYDTAFTGEAEYRQFGAATQFVFPIPGFPLSPDLSDHLYVLPWVRKRKREVRFPDSLALGLAFRPNDRLTLALDVTRTDWNDFLVKDADGSRYSLVDFSDLDDPVARTDFDPTYTVRFGIEHVFIPKQPDEEAIDRLWTLRGGLFYDEEPATQKKSTGQGRFRRGGTGKPDRFYGAALGLGLLLKQRVNLDLAYQVRYGHGVNADFLRGVPGFEEDVLQHRVLLSTVIYF